MRGILTAVLLTLSLGGCTIGQVAAGIGAVTVGSIGFTDKNPLEHAHAFFDRRCENQSYMDEHRRCRR